jgi:hypothetical protein
MKLQLSIFGWMTLLLLICSAPADDGEEFFRRQVQPVLRSRCYACHSHESGEMNGGLTLDWRSGWSEGGSRGPALVPGKPDESLLIRAISHQDPDLQMPEEKLPETEIAVLVEWVQRGAPDPRQTRPSADQATDWWSLRPLARPEVPPGSGNPIDAFIRAGLREKQLAPSPEADRRTLMRRLHFDLHGLPPTPGDVDQFINSRDPMAWENLVDRLLASPRYGERWARHWLDTIHFADTHGYEHDILRTNAWRYRDFVIDSFNRDTPWPRFIREQLAADLFFPDEPALAVALGFLGAGPYDQSAAGTAPQSFEYLDRDDLVTQTMAAFLSTTANCARCHTHKFDPITQEDYFSLQAVFAGVGKGDLSFDTDVEVARQRQRWQQLKIAAESRNAHILLAPENAALVAEWEQRHAKAPDWAPLNPETYLSSNGATLRKEADASLTSSGTRPDVDILTVTGVPPIPDITAMRLEVLTDDSLPLRGPGRMDNGNLHLSELEIYLFRQDSHESQRIAIRRASADFEQQDWTIAHAVDGDAKTAWGIHPQVGQAHEAVFELAEPLNVGPQDKLCVVLKQLHGRGHLIGRCRLAVTNAPAASVIVLPEAIAAVLSRPPSQRTDDERIALAAAVLSRYSDDALARLPAAAKVYAAGSRVDNERGMLIYEQPRLIRILNRGDLNSPGQEVGPGALSAVHELEARFRLPENAGEAARRACLANWIADPKNPLTWRSIANRVWHYHFGRGLCDTPSDFGRMGGIPSHPELLDWLAVELRDQGGSLKHLQRLICTSQTYRQSSAFRPEAAALDPDNRWLWRMNRPRLDADSYRDSVQAISGRLDLTMHGPGVAHFLSSPGPQNTPTLDYQSFDWDSPGAGRRSIYRIVWRGIPDPFLDLLDFPDAAMLAPVRGFSSSPLQSLALLNNQFVLRHSQHLAQRVASHQCQPVEQVRSAVRLVWLRNPTGEETQALLDLSQRHSLAAVCRLLFNSNEFLFVD